MEGTQLKLEVIEGSKEAVAPPEDPEGDWWDDPFACLHCKKIHQVEMLDDDEEECWECGNDHDSPDHHLSYCCCETDDECNRYFSLIQLRRTISAMECAISETKAILAKLKPKAPPGEEFHCIDWDFRKAIHDLTPVPTLGCKEFY